MGERKTSDVLRAARALISDPKRWTKGDMARSAAGYPVYADSPEAVCWCAEGALWSVGTEDNAYDALCNACPGEAPHEYNDNHTHEEVLAMFDRAIAEREAADD